ncbi:hypothetical protein [Agrococcus casei]|uniref:hypothetical protein n=1 Tax=Agrococcus casei TaxID=343512 RepID=UPI003F9245BA
MAEVQLGNDALACVTFWARTQAWFPRESDDPVVFTDEIRLPRAGARILFARSGAYAFIIPIAISHEQHPASIAFVNGEWLIDGLEHAATQQELLDAATGHVHTACLRGTGGARLRTEEDGTDWQTAFRRVLRGDASVEARLSDDLYRGGSVAMPQVLSQLSAEWHDGNADRVSEFLLVRERWPGERRAVELLEVSAAAAAAGRASDDSTETARRMGEVIAVLHDAAGASEAPGASASLRIIEDVLDEDLLPARDREWLSAECLRFRHMQRRMRPAPTLPGLTLDSMLLADDSAGFFDLASDWRGVGLNADDAGRLAFGVVCIAERASKTPLTSWVTVTIESLAEGARMDSPPELVSLRIAMLAEALSVLRGQPTLAAPRCIDRQTLLSAGERTLDYLREHGSALSQRSRLLA